MNSSNKEQIQLDIRKVKYEIKMMNQQIASLEKQMADSISSCQNNMDKLEFSVSYAELLEQLNEKLFELEEQPCQSEIQCHLRQAWEEWIATWRAEGDYTRMLLVRTIELCAGRSNLIVHSDNYGRLTQLTSSMCSSLQHQLQISKGNINGKEIAGDKVTDSQMQELVRCVLQWSDGPGNQTKQKFLAITKSFYYDAHCTPTMLNSHITKVLFERVV